MKNVKLVLILIFITKFETKMKAFKVVLFIAALAIAFASCRKTTDNPNPGNETLSMNELVVPQDFNWETTKDVEINLGISGTKAYEAKSMVYVFSKNPNDGGKLLTSGSASPGSNFTTTLRLASFMDQVFLKMEGPFGESNTATVPIDGNLISYNFNMKSSGNDFKVFTDPECDEEGDIIITETSGTITIDNGDYYSLSGNFSGSLVFTNAGGTLKICGNAEFTNNVQLNFDSHHLIITQGGSATFSDLSLTSSGSSIEVYSNSELYINSNFSPKGWVYNDGLIDVDGSWENSGNDSYFDNYGTILVNGHMSLNSATDNYNGCKIIVQDKFHQNNPSCTFTMGEGSYLESGVETEFTKDHTYLYEGAMIETPGFFANNQSVFTVYGDAIVHVTEEMDINGDIDGPLTIAYDPGVEVNASGDLTNGANVTPTGDVTLLLPVSDCNPTGFGSPEVLDADFDGVPDNIDEYPNDSERASNSYFPGENQWGTVGFEDLWPSVGDYDFNDMILDYTGILVKNADNEVKDLIITFKVRAVGASFNNGFGFQLENVAPENVEIASGFIHESDEMDISLNANGTEAGQTKAVIIPVETVNSIINRETSGSMFNTIPGGGSGTSDELEITVTFVNAVPDEDMGPEDFNPFLIKNQDRTVEIHLPDMPPTDLADESLFGTAQDDSNPATGKYYKTKNNLPWAIMFTEQFDYPIEKSEITDVYNYFGEWAQSGNTVYQDWYSNTAPGYRNTNDIY
jgi:LruC domain-containing protein